ncbi:hypothetical protein CCMA1212_003899 [Trichoderma ghanense]|uniref:Uncharacterized protein n=1 Tax=Trichoderma ghanense TaxID=65468 RepID=A0ABY2H729_9HYPO
MTAGATTGVVKFKVRIVERRLGLEHDPGPGYGHGQGQVKPQGHGGYVQRWDPCASLPASPTSISRWHQPAPGGEAVTSTKSWVSFTGCNTSAVFHLLSASAYSSTLACELYPASASARVCMQACTDGGVEVEEPKCFI